MVKKPTEPTQHRYQHVREQLMSRFDQYAVDAQLPSNRQLAEEFGVALLTVKRAMDTLAADGYIDRIQGKGTFLRSRERQVQNGQADRPSGTVLAAIPSYFSYEYWRRVAAAEELALKRGYALTEYRIHVDTTYVALAQAAAAIDDLRAVLIDPVPESLGPKAIAQLEALGVPVAIFSYSKAAARARNLVTIHADFHLQGYQQAELLLAAGHRCIGYVDAEPPGQDGSQRVKGIQQALADAGLGKRELVRHKHRATRAWTSSMEAGYHIARKLLERGEVTALATDSIASAQGAYRAAYELGLRIPDQLSVVASGEMGEVEDYMAPPLATVHSRIDDEMALAFDLLGGGDQRLSSYECAVTVEPRSSIAPPPD